ncbi:signal recognition particle protein [Victivallis sp. Marseille-Q1083]|uniref:signal recognition particle protein n=1 Tax=Victivallis sp. Marseille-Q1083 TaxID=2717288 RepID=UPI00158EA146|nr:signal recognition particle protein [Victivallis sp. Marseille-Q1083]
MFDALSDKLHDVFRHLRGQAKLTEENIAEAMREIRLALLEADVNLEVAKSFIDAVRSDCVGQEVIRSVTPGQQVIKIVNDRLVELLGTESAGLNLAAQPSVIMLVGLHGSGKTTTAAKLAKLLTREKKTVMLVAGDIYRPAAVDQLEFLGREIGVPVFTDRGNINVASIAVKAINEAKFRHIDVVILDTAGRLQIDEAMVQELVRVRQAIRADETLLVADAALGQEAVAVADTFHKALDLTGFILTKLDGDARGGAALSIRKVTNCPVKFIGVGEKLDDLEPFHPERMASRILGMGDVVSLVERAAAEIDEEEARKLQEKLKKNKFDFEDFLAQLRQISKMGGIESIAKFLPGGRQLTAAMEGFDPKYFSRLEAIILSMTRAERSDPDLIDFSRRKRIAAGSGTSLEQVSGLIKQVTQMRKMLRKNGMLGRLFSGGSGTELSMASAASGPSLGGFAVTTANRKEAEKRKRLAKMQKKERAKQRKKKK